MSLTVERVDARGLLERVGAWEALAASAAEPNPFYEPWMLRPAITHLARDVELSFALVLDGAKLCGLFPLAGLRRFHGIPLRASSLWRHRQCFSARPLMRAGSECDTWRALFGWFESQARSSIVELTVQPAGTVHEALIDVVGDRALCFDSYTRALLRRGTDADSYLRGVMSGDRRRRLRNRTRQLGKIGQVTHRTLDDSEDLPRWVADFLALEASGWKGQAGSALASTPGGGAFFADVMRQAFERNRLLMMGLFIDDRPAALFTGFLVDGGVVAFKSAMDESLARCSPGVLLMLDVIERVHQLPPAIRWLDSCSASDSWLKQLLGERLPVHSLLLAPQRGGFAEALVAGAPLLRWGWRRLRPASLEAA